MIVELATIGGALVGMYWMGRIRRRKQSEAREMLYEAKAAEAVELFINTGHPLFGWCIQTTPDGSYVAELFKSELGYATR